MEKILIIISFLFLLNSCNTQDCNGLSSSFTDYNSALIEIKKHEFSIEEETDTSESSWVKGASFFSCDSEEGFFLLKARNEEYIHQNVPVKVWREFKASDSFGTYYTKNIKGRFQLKLKK